MNEHRTRRPSRTRPSSPGLGRRPIIIATAHLAKGLEFDQVIVPHCTSENYRTVIGRHMLYVACTRAMHRLHLFHVGKPSSFLAVAVN